MGGFVFLDPPSRRGRLMPHRTVASRGSGGRLHRPSRSPFWIHRRLRPEPRKHEGPVAGPFASSVALSVAAVSFSGPLHFRRAFGRRGPSRGPPRALGVSCTGGSSDASSDGSSRTDRAARRRRPLCAPRRARTPTCVPPASPSATLASPPCRSGRRRLPRSSRSSVERLSPQPSAGGPRGGRACAAGQSRWSRLGRLAVGG